ncbi:MBL fold metallo-hydrolase [Halalkalicoccus jeotgali]|uniref:Beta-lactamase domain protein n=1 Tax=Halalkalicoccus jeotgali (strain DSM 18796 / CECT 7217 / JCM 14584 / KCTC 4019 / B3) TaxID=795797 RepID=D8J3A1_HALJB|nr:MBL fold metallo-hydrolase [Halalkalicoccus jeotgali]ADJ15208.1 beta-lactamase domain protein [Halalkalicoccus jeotgali B3]ELY35215.1 beta-lactamase domain-containing protein [Halalkalicoccus jeotgali B3]
MRITFLGTGSAMPTGERFQTGLLLEREGRTLLVDCGSGALHGLARTSVGYEGVSSVLLTHHHLDHVADLLPLMKARWLAGEDHLEIAGPRGTKSLVDGLLNVHEYMRGRLDLTVREVGPYDFEIADFSVEGYETRHSMYCLAYRFGGVSESDSEVRETKSRGVFTFSADSDAFEGLANFAEGSAVLVHDCSFPDDTDVSGHPTPAQLGEALSGHEIGRIYLSHLYPHTDGRHEEMLESIAAQYDGDVRFAEDGLSVTIS